MSKTFSYHIFIKNYFNGTQPKLKGYFQYKSCPFQKNWSLIFEFQFGSHEDVRLKVVPKSKWKNVNRKIEMTLKYLLADFEGWSKPQILIQKPRKTVYGFFQIHFFLNPNLTQPWDLFLMICRLKGTSDSDSPKLNNCTSFLL